MLKHPGLHPQSKRVGVPTDFWGFLKRCWDAAVAEKQRKQQQKAKKPTALASTEGVSYLS